MKSFYFRIFTLVLAIISQALFVQANWVKLEKLKTNRDAMMKVKTGGPTAVILLTKDPKGPEIVS